MSELTTVQFGRVTISINATIYLLVQKLDKIIPLIVVDIITAVIIFPKQN